MRLSQKTTQGLSENQVLERRLDVVKAQSLFDQVAVRLGTLAKNS